MTTNTTTPSSFYNQNSTAYTDHTPPGPDDQPVTSPPPAPSSFYKGTGATYTDEV